MSRQIIQVFEEYQKARVKFVQTVAELARSPGAVPSLQAAGAMALLRPLLLDTVPSVQQAASVAIGRLASHSQELAEAVVAAEILPQLVYSLADQNRFYKKSAAIVLRAVARHSPGLAQAVSDCGAVEALVGCLEEFDTGVKETAAWALAHVARHSPALATKVVDASAVPLLVLAVQEPEVAVKHVAVACLADIAKHTPELAQTVVDGGAVPHIAALIASSDARLRRQVCCALAHVARHSAELAEVVVDATVLPRIFDLLRDVDAGVRKNAATCVRELCKHSAELSQLVVNAGGAAALVDFVASSAGAAQLPGTMALGYIAAFSETLALSLLVAQAVPPLAACLEPDCEDFARAAAAWALGQLGRHTAEHARRVADGNVLPRLLAIVVAPEGAASADTRAKAKHALKAVVLRCTHLPALSPLLHAPAAPPGVLKHVLGQYARLLPLDVAAKREFLSSRGLAVLQSIKATPGSELADAIAAINRCYPPEIVQFFSPDYADTFADKIAAYQASGAV